MTLARVDDKGTRDNQLLSPPGRLVSIPTPNGEQRDHVSGSAVGHHTSGDPFSGWTD